jgi:hypothetical protein
VTAERYESNVVAGPGGVMTGEAGVITGDVTVRTEVDADEVTVRIQYQDADEWYHVEGSPLRATVVGGPSLHDAIVYAVEQGLPDGLGPLGAAPRGR